MAILKIISSTSYLMLSAMAVNSVNDSYEKVFSDPFFWAAAFIGMGLMLFIEKKDPKIADIKIRRVAFSVLACLAIIFVTGTVRASMLENKDFERNHYFYAIVLFLCSIAPELIRIIVTDSPKAIGDGFTEGIRHRTKKFVGGNDADFEPYNEPNNE